MTDTEYMRIALRLAARGRGNVSPNPMVGAVVVRNGTITGTGWHRVYGGAHAEVEALNDAGPNAQGATVYCTLEPCTHFGKTPPCSDALIAAGVSKVVIAMVDPNEQVNGKGVKRLRNAGVEVTTGVCEREARRLNEAFIKHVTTGMPYVTVKMAQTLDGKISHGRGERTAITGEQVQKYVHRMRTWNDAVLVGRNTAAVDDPLLTPRLVRGKMPVRVVLDSALSLNPGLKLFSTADTGKVFIFTGEKNRNRAAEFEERGVTVIAANTQKDGRVDLTHVLKRLGKLGISSVLVEGGAELFGSFIEARLADRLVFFVAPAVFGCGVGLLNFGGDHRRPFRMSIEKTRKIGGDLMIAALPVYD